MSAIETALLFLPVERSLAVINRATICSARKGKGSWLVHVSGNDRVAALSRGFKIKKTREVREGKRGQERVNGYRRVGKDGREVNRSPARSAVKLYVKLCDVSCELNRRKRH